MLALVTSCWLGFLSGLRHALDPDHLAAVSTLVVEQPKRWRAALLGASWGIGHSASLLGAGALLLVWRAQLPERWAEAFELGVAIMLICLGMRSLRQSLRARGAAAVPHHAGAAPVPRGETPPFPPRPWRTAPPPLSR